MEKVLQGLLVLAQRFAAWWGAQFKSARCLGKVVILFISLFAVCCVFSVISSAIRGTGEAVGLVSTRTATAAPPTRTPTLAPSATPIPSSTPTLAPSATPEPTATPGPPTETPLPTEPPTATPLPPPTAEPDNSIEAGIICERFVTKRLKSPSTAKFASVIWDGVRAVKSGKNQYTFRSWVDSQNSFGAMIRTQFNCVIEDAGDQWKLVDLQTEP